MATLVQCTLSIGRIGLTDHIALTGRTAHIGLAAGFSTSDSAAPQSGGMTNDPLQWVELSDEYLNLRVDISVYSEAALFRACYLYTDRCYLFLSATQDRITVEFRRKTADADLQEIAGDFGNELINQRLRADLARETAPIRELIVAQAFAEAEFDDPSNNS